MSLTADSQLLPLPKREPQSGRDSQSGATPERRAYLISPLVDFLCLGGASLIVLPLMALILPAERFEAPLAVTMMALTNLINHPHFAHSYQIFYRDFRRKAFGAESDQILRYRYIFAGIVAPILLLTFFSSALALGDLQMLGLGMNLMTFLVGWHYIKQGYGMAVVDSVFKRLFFSDRVKKVMLVNGYACWILAWMLGNREFAEKDYWGVAYYTFHIPEPMLQIAAIFAAVTTLATLIALFSAWRKNGGKLPLNGIIAYLTTLYLWVVFVKINPLFILMVPAFHSLQYLLVVWRFQMNLEQGQPDSRERPAKRWLGAFTPSNATGRFTAFLASGIALGFLFFWAIPFFASGLVGYDKELFGGTLFFFICWIFINVHHYCLDNVMWRRENPETKKHLFS